MCLCTQSIYEKQVSYSNINNISVKRSTEEPDEPIKKRPRTDIEVGLLLYSVKFPFLFVSLSFLLFHYWIKLY